MAQFDDDVITTIKPKLDIAEPSLYKVIYLNDDKTTFEFVIDSLMVIFNHDKDSAVNLAHEINEHGSAIVAVLTYELAEQKMVEVTTYARSNGFPLKVKIEANL